MKRVLITGGTGLIGRALAGDLSAASYEVILLSRRPERTRDLPAGVRAVKWDGRTPAGWGELANGAAAIVNLAGESIGGGRWTPGRRQHIRDSRLNAGVAVVEAVRRATPKPGVVIQASGIGVYGDGGDKVLNEESPAGRDWLSSFTATEWEPCTVPVEALGVRRAIVRTGVVLARGGQVLIWLVLPHRFFVGGPLGGGRQWVAWVHLADEVGAIRFLIEHPTASGLFNLCAPNPLTNADLERAIGRVMGRPAWFPVPAFALRLLFGQMASVLLDGQRAVPRRLLELGYRFQYPDAESALRDLLR